MCQVLFLRCIVVLYLFSAIRRRKVPIVSAYGRPQSTEEKTFGTQGKYVIFRK